MKENSPLISPCHGKEHLAVVGHYADWLHSIYGGDPEIIQAAVLLHDLGRTTVPNLHDQDRRQLSMTLAKAHLQTIAYDPEKIPAVLACIRDHDQPKYSPPSLEGKILKDADFLAGFGAWGILRIILWTYESDDPHIFYQKLRERLTVKLPARAAGLEFPESRALASQLNVIVSMFISQLW